MATKWRNTDESAEYLRERHGIPVAGKTLRNLRALGKGPRWHYFGSKPLASEDDLNAYAATALKTESPVRRNLRERKEREAQLRAKDEHLTENRAP